MTLFLGFRINRNNKKNSQPKIPVLPVLYVAGNKIKRSDDHQKIQLKGVSTTAFAYEGCPIGDEHIKVLEKIKLWKINLLGLFIDPVCFKAKVMELDSVIDWAEKSFIYVYLMPRASDHRDLFDQLKQFPSMMGQLSQRYAKKNNVFYGFWAEPNMSWKNLYKLSDSIAKEIIKNKPDALMLMTGTEYSRYFDFENKLPYKNLIYDFHDYPATDIKELSQILKKDKMDFLWDKSFRSYPVLVGEFGGVWQSGFGSQEDLRYIQLLLDNVNKNSLNYSAYTIDGHDDVRDVEFGIGLINWETGLTTKKGELIKNDLLNYPPTDFSK